MRTGKNNWELVFLSTCSGDDAKYIFTVTTEIFLSSHVREKNRKLCVSTVQHDVSRRDVIFHLMRCINNNGAWRVCMFGHTIFSIFFSTADDKDTIRPPGMGRITGSASIETLVRVGIEKENGLSPDSKMIVLHDFTPCVDDELEVKQGNVSFAYIHMFSVCAALMIPRVFPGCERAVPRKRLGLCHWRRSTRRFYSSFVLCSLYATSWRNDADCKKEITKRFGHSQRDRH